MAEFKRVFPINDRSLIQVLRVSKVVDDEGERTEWWLISYYEDTGEIQESKIFEFPDWAQPQNDWRGETAGEKIMSFLNYEYETIIWLLEITVDNEESVDPALRDRLNRVLNAAIELIKIPDTKDLGKEAIRRMLYGTKRLYWWPTTKRRGKTGRRPTGAPHAMIVMHDVLLRKYSILRKKNRYEIIRRALSIYPLYYQNGTIDKIIQRNQHLVPEFKNGLSESYWKRDYEIRCEVERCIDEIVKKVFQ